MSDKPQQVEAWLNQLGQPGADRDYQPGHARMHALLEPLSLRQPALRIRVAGTNGKGSTSWMLTAALQKAGLKTGLFTSPHLLSFNERIRIDGQPVHEDVLLSGLREIMPLALQCGASYFEVATALALWVFHHAGVDAEVLEAGVGARLDSTTAVPADMGVLTPVALDHQAWLGDSLAEIAAEKIHVFDGCKLAVSAMQPDAVRALLVARRPDVHLVVEGVLSASAMAGIFQQKNAALAMLAVDLLRDEGMLKLEACDAEAAIAGVVVPGRLQLLHHAQAVIWLDVAHNSHAVEALLPFLNTLDAPLDAIMVYTREDRDLGDALPMLKPYAQCLMGRAGDGFDRHVDSVGEAITLLLGENPASRILVLGSFITAGEVLCVLNQPDLAAGVITHS